LIEAGLWIVDLKLRQVAVCARSRESPYSDEGPRDELGKLRTHHPFEGGFGLSPWGRYADELESFLRVVVEAAERPDAPGRHEHHRQYQDDVRPGRTHLKAPV
jgi:hypothetical protein